MRRESEIGHGFAATDPPIKPEDDVVPTHAVVPVVFAQYAGALAKAAGVFAKYAGALAEVAVASRRTSAHLDAMAVTSRRKFGMGRRTTAPRLRTRAWLTES